MRATPVLFSLVLSLILLSCDIEREPVEEFIQGVPDEFSAVWLNDAYLAELRASRSPMAALNAADNDKVAITLRRDGDVFVRSILYRFNDRRVDTFNVADLSVVRGPVYGDGTLDQAVKQLVGEVDPQMKGDEVQLDLLKVENGQFLLLTNNEGERKLLWRQVGDTNVVEAVTYSAIQGGTNENDYAIDNFVSGLILEGTFADESGSQTIFTAEGDVAWDGQGRYYAMLLGDMMTDCDVLILSDDPSGAAPHEFYGFKRNENSLDLYVAVLDSNNRIVCTQDFVKTLTLQQ